MTTVLAENAFVEAAPKRGLPQLPALFCVDSDDFSDDGLVGFSDFSHNIGSRYYADLYNGLKELTLPDASKLVVFSDGHGDNCSGDVRFFMDMIDGVVRTKDNHCQLRDDEEFKKWLGQPHNLVGLKNWNVYRDHSLGEDQAKTRAQEVFLKAAQLLGTTAQPWLVKMTGDFPRNPRTVLSGVLGALRSFAPDSPIAEVNLYREREPSQRWENWMVDIGD